MFYVVMRYTMRYTDRLPLLTACAAVLGLAGGAAAWVLLHLIGLITSLALFHTWSWHPPSTAELHPGPWLVVAAAAGGLVVSLLAKWAPVIRGHGIPEAMEAVLVRQSRIQPRTAVAKPVSAAVAIGTGGPFGAEGPIIVTGGSLGSLLGQVLHVSASERKILLAAGAAAGMAATFGAPLASVVLAIELLLFEFSARAFLPLVVSASIAAGVHHALIGSGPLFSPPAQDAVGSGQLPLFAALGLGCGLLAVLIAKGLFAVEHGFRRLPGSDFWHPVLGSLGFAAVGLFVPRALGVGYDAIQDVIDGRLALGAVAILLVAKLVAWWLALGSGTSGGTLAPVLLMAGCFGSMAGSIVDHLAPGLGVSPGVCAVVAMAATFGAATGATFAAIVFVFELTGDYALILPLMLATVAADLVARGLLDGTLMTEKLGRRGLKVRIHYEPDVFRTTTVASVMQPPEPSVTGRDLAGATAVRPHDPILAALAPLADLTVKDVPVIDDDGNLVGVCTRHDLLSARLALLAHEQPQPGWLARRRGTGPP
jgi:chloride channel protein, CIC family